MPKNKFFTQLLGEVEAPRVRSPSRSSAASDLDLVPVEAVVLVEAGVLGGDHRVLQVGRDLSKRNELVAVRDRACRESTPVRGAAYARRWWADRSSARQRELARRAPTAAPGR